MHSLLEEPWYSWVEWIENLRRWTTAESQFEGCNFGWVLGTLFFFFSFTYIDQFYSPTHFKLCYQGSKAMNPINYEMKSHSLNQNKLFLFIIWLSVICYSEGKLINMGSYTVVYWFAVVLFFQFDYIGEKNHKRPIISL